MKWIAIIFFSINISGYFSIQRQNLGGIWSLDEDNGAYSKLNATVPGGVFSDLMLNKIIDDPVLEENDQKSKWVGRSNWTYSRNFTVDGEFLSHDTINIVFEGLDTVSTIILNGKTIGNSSNMFVRYIFDIKNDLLESNNLIEVKFVSPVQASEQLAKQQSQSYSVPPECPPSDYNGECHINELRKMQASFSWDWGPSLASVGIWKDIYLEAFNNSVIRYNVVEMTENLLDSSWNVTVVTYLSNNALNNINGKLILHLNTDYNTNLTIVQYVNETIYEMDDFGITMTFAVSQSSVRKWWPNGYGEQCLYNLTVTFLSGVERDVHSQKVGFRTIELVQEVLEGKKASIGNSFYFKVNGLPIFAKGSNAIPINILPEKGQDRKSVDNLLESARDCNMNMLRVWGGGVYESDYYYQRADELGIMIWQDFMFACALYPTRDEFLSNVIADVRHQVRRIGSHPSIVLWAGNNENEAAITGNWYGSNGKQIYNDDYIKLYFKVIKPTFKSLLSKGTFIGSSPTNGLKSEQDGGISKNPYDLHYGDDHTYIYELDSFNANIYPTPRFSSEYGFQSYPSMYTLEKSTRNASNLVMGGSFLKHRQHHPLGDIQMKLLIFYQLDLPDEKSSNYTNVFIFYSQVIQAVAIKTETEHYRRYRSLTNEDGTGLTMGALYWQLNDVWIAPTWSGIDVTGKWKILQYFVRNAFSPISIIGHLNNKRDLEITAVSDKTITIEDVTLSISVYNWTSFVPVNVTKQTITLEKGSSKNIRSIETDKYLNQLGCGGLVQAKRNCFFHLALTKSNVNIAPENFVIPDKLKSLNLKRPDIEISSVELLNEMDKKNYKITLKTSSIALFVWLDGQGIFGKFSENGFHQITETKTIYFESEKETSVDFLRENLSVSNIVSVY